MATKFNFKPGRPGTQKNYGTSARYPSYRKLRDVIQEAEKKDIPKEIIDELNNVIGMVECREMYIDKHCSAESDTLREIRLFTVDKDWTKAKEAGDISAGKSSGMMTGKVEGEFLKFLVSMQKAKRVLDIGMFTGYSALAMAEAVPPDGVVVTCDLEQYLEEVNHKNFDKSPHGSKIDIRIGNAKDTMLSLADEGQKFDFIFVDADKEGYVSYYDTIMDQGLLAPGGTIAFDNAFRGGRAYLMENDNTSDALNRKVETDPRVRRVLVPLRDGVLLVRRAEDVVM